MIVHNFDPVFIDLGILQIRWYSIAYILGITLGWIYANKLINTKIKKKFNFVTSSQFDDLLIYLVLGIVIGGRLGYVIFYNLEYYSNNLLEVFKIWKGGMSFHGGLMGVIFANFIFSKMKKINFFIFSDLICCVAPIGLFLGRIANFINGELYGKISTLPWSVIFPGGGELSRHPSQIYEAILEGGVLFVLINYLALKKQLIFKPGVISGLFLIWYSVFRLFSENFREPDLHIGYFFNYFSMGTILSFFTLVTGLFIILFIKKNEQTN